MVNDRPQHDGCWNCGTLDEPILTSKAIYNVTLRSGKPGAPYSIALCSAAPCQAVDHIDFRERAGGA
jgi:hypothetical protein